MKIIAIAGTLGAGKGTVVDYLIEKKGFIHFSVRKFLIEEIEKRNMPINRDSMRIVADGLREKNSPGFIIEQLYERAKQKNQNCIIESIRCPGEIDVLKGKENFILLAVDGDIKTRYQRAILRNSETDNISFEKFVKQEDAENNNVEPFKMNLKTCIKRSDYIIKNNSTIKDLYKQIDEVL